MRDRTDDLIERATAGDVAALEALIRHIQDNIYRLAMRMLSDQEAAQDATQEILIRIVTKLSTFKGESRFETWTYRIATNYLLTAKKVLSRDPGLSFSMFAEDLLNGLADDSAAAPEDHVMLNELRVRCTMAMLMCLDRTHRVAYVLGEILEFDHAGAAVILDISPANFRKRLSRARTAVQDFTSASCGLASRSAKCSCRKRLPAAIAGGRIGAAPTTLLSDAPDYATVKAEAAQLEAGLIAAKLQRATGQLNSSEDFATTVLSLVDPPG